MIGKRDVLFLAVGSAIAILLALLVPAGSRISAPAVPPSGASDPATVSSRGPIEQTPPPDENPIEYLVTTKPEDIRTLFRTPQPQADFPVAAMRYTLRALPDPAVGEIRLIIPAWDLDAAVYEQGKRLEVTTRFWYSDKVRRPGVDPAPFEVVATRAGSRTVLFRGMAIPRR
jgi:hypothetical protein